MNPTSKFHRQPRSGKALVVGLSMAGIVVLAGAAVILAARDTSGLERCDASVDEARADDGLDPVAVSSAEGDGAPSPAFFCTTLPGEPTHRDVSVMVASPNATDPLGVGQIVLVHPGGPGVSPITYLRRAGGRPLSLDDTAFIAIDGESSETERGYCGPADRIFVSERSTELFEADIWAAAREECISAPIHAGSSFADADELVRVLDELGIERVSMLTHSYGTAVAEMMLRRHPDRIDRVVADGVFASDVSGDDRIAAVHAAIERVVPQLLDGCPAEPECSGPVADLLASSATYEELRSSVLALDPVLGAGNDPLMPVMFDQAALVALRNTDYWVAFYRGLDGIINNGDGAVLMSLAERLALGTDRQIYLQSVCPSQLPPASAEPYRPTGDHVFDAWLADASLCGKWSGDLETILTGAAPATRPAGQSTEAAPAVDVSQYQVVRFGSSDDPLTPIELADSSAFWAAVPACDTGIVGHTSFGDPATRASMTAFLSGSIDASEVSDRC